MKAGEVYLCDWCNKEITLTPVKRCKFRKRLHQFCSKVCYLSFHSRKTKTLYCHSCGKPITAKFDYSKLRRNGWRKFCSKACLHNWRREQQHSRQKKLLLHPETVKTCPQCKLQFKPTSKKTIYCSDRCKNTYYTEKSKQPANCTQCGTSMLQSKYNNKRRPFCSIKCLNKFLSIHNTGRRTGKMVHCTICNKELYRVPNRLSTAHPLCSYKCLGIWFSMRRGPDHPLYRGLSYIGYLDFRKELKLRVRERDNNRCVLCGDSNKHLNVHHIDYNKKNPSANNLITLCNPCHRYTNHYRWFWKKLLSGVMVKIVEARIAILQGQMKTELQKIEHHIHAVPFPPLGTTARSLYHTLARLHPKSVLRPTDESCPEHIQIPFVKELLCRIEETPSTEPSSRNLHSPEWQSGTGFP